jgi:gamma-glutamyltranspeptidase/glutathione hydrolase
MLKHLLLPLTLALASCVTAPAPDVPSGAAGAVSSADPRATEAGLEILRQGGSAADAAMAVMLALTVVEPQSSGIGGGSFMLYHDAAANRLLTYDGRETAPAAAGPDRFLRADGTPMPSGEAVPGGLSVGVPGNIRLAALAHERHGRLPWAALFAPAIRLAQEGFEVTPRLSARIGGARIAQLRQSPEGRAIYLTAEGQPRPAGSRIANPGLAALLREIAAQGADAFYRGPAAERLRQAVASAPVNPATISESDLAGYRVRERDPVCGRYRTYRICGMGPPSSGGIAVYTILKQLERFDMAALGRDNPLSWHLIAESMRLAYADRARWIGDPDFASVPIGGLTSDAYLASRSAMIRLDRAMPSVAAGLPPGAARVPAVDAAADGGTSHLSVVDGFGNAASVTSTIEAGFGSGLVVDGYVLNNELTDFSFVPQRDGALVPNWIEPGKRPLSSMSPTIVYDEQGRVVLVIGAAGGPTIIAQVAKALFGVLDWGLPVDEALALPQVIGMGNRVQLEPGERTAAWLPVLRALGHQQVEVAAFQSQGASILKLNAIERTATGWRAAADPRSEGTGAGE